jgi:hypothetical protein
VVSGQTFWLMWAGIFTALGWFWYRLWRAWRWEQRRAILHGQRLTRSFEDRCWSKLRHQEYQLALKLAKARLVGEVEILAVPDLARIMFYAGEDS